MAGTSWERTGEHENGAMGATAPPGPTGGAAKSRAREPRTSGVGTPRNPRSRKGATARGAALAPRRSTVGVVVVDPLPLFRAGGVAALGAGGVRVLGEAAHLADGVPLARSSHAGAVLLGGASVDEAKEAVAALPSCAVVVLLAQPSRTELVDMLGAGVAGLALRSLTADELVGTVEAAAEGIASPGAPAAAAPVFVPFPVGPTPVEPPDLGVTGPEATLLTPKEREILGQLAQGASNKRIAEALFVTPATVKTHLAHIYAKLGARGRHEALTHALSMGLLR
jgi:DNA-binding NarL/FixJ family response regulator